MNRRQFLATVLAASAAAPALARTRLRVIVIGAGLAGLGAATTLVKAGHEVVVLEARPRLGGRTWTDTSLGVPVDLGAGWIEGTVDHPMADFARRLHLRLVRTRDDFTLFAGGKRFTRAETERVDDLWEKLYRRLQALKEEGAEGSVADGITTAMKGMKLTARDERDLRWAALSAIEGDDAGDQARLSLAAWDEDGGKKGANVMLPGGFGQIVRHLAKGLDVRLSTPVTRVAWDGRRARVWAGSGVLEADRVVVTLPLGVLKKGTVAFEPALPARHAGVIARLEMGTLDRVVLRFPRRFWSDDTDWMASVDDPHFVDLIGMQHVTGVPIIACLVGGMRALALEKHTDAEMVSMALESVRRMYGAKVPAPTAHAVTRWAADPYTWGSYSIVPVGARMSDHRELGRPAGVLHFAGEATHPRYPGTTHGAYLSGVRAAREIIGG